MRRLSPLALAVCLAASGCYRYTRAGALTPPGMSIRVRFAEPRDVPVVSRTGKPHVATGVVTVEGRLLGIVGDTLTLDVTGRGKGIWSADGERSLRDDPWTTATVVRTAGAEVEQHQVAVARTLLAVWLAAGVLAGIAYLVALAQGHGY
ncbi:MAG: hypothetical protein ACJ8AO_21205 [Gemmatimonadaceae bacterium]